LVGQAPGKNGTLVSAEHGPDFGRSEGAQLFHGENLVEPVPKINFVHQNPRAVFKRVFEPTEKIDALLMMAPRNITKVLLHRLKVSA
jgi:hypothetical protein